MISEEEKKDIQEIKEIISKLGQKKRAMVQGYISALRDVDALENKQKEAV